MRSINKVIIIGNLTRAPEMRQTPSGQSVTTFGVATNRTWVTKNSEKKSEAEYHEVVAWGNLAEICSKYLKKGKLVYIEGYLKTRSWDTPEGIRRFKTEIVIQDMIMLDKKSSGEEDYIPQDDMHIRMNDNSMPMTEETSVMTETPVTNTPAVSETIATEEPKQETPSGQSPNNTGSSLGIDDDLGL